MSELRDINAIYYIRVENDEAVGFPQEKENIINALNENPDDPNNNWELIDCSADFNNDFEWTLLPYEQLAPDTYEKINEVWTVVENKEDMSGPVLVQKQEFIKQELESGRDFQLALAIEDKGKETDPEKIALWEGFIIELEDWVFDPNDPNPTLPPLPAPLYPPEQEVILN
ncbi:MAG: hypothetical protein CBD88_00550 [Flavobacteriales bacterium TMED228]|nr:MAG: hypothetical protein CBD88_00550 [Flavobacteriales bacterium TMED228]